MATPPDFTAGQVLTAAQMNAVGLWKITSAAFTTVAGFSLPNGSFTADYRNYKLIVRLTAVATDADFTGRMRVGGVDASGANTYAWGWGGANTAGTSFSGASAGAATSFNLQESDNDATFGFVYTLDLDLFGPQIAEPTNVQGHVMYVNKAATETRFRTGGGTHNVSTSYDSFSFISTQNITGRYWLYGYRD